MKNTVSDYRRLSHLRGQRPINFFRAAVVGLSAGLLAVCFQIVIEQAETARTELLGFLTTLDTWGLPLFALFCASLGGFAGWLTVRFSPEATGGGIPHTKAVVLHLRSLPWARVIPVKFIGATLAIGAGFSLGREGPTVHLGAAAGAAVAKLLKVPRRAMAHLISCGAGAGLSAAFNAPLAGFIFVIEELRRELSPLTYGTALIAVVCADIVARALIGSSPSFEIRNFPSLPLTALPLVIAVGLLTGLAGVAFNRLLLSSLKFVPTLRSRLPRWGRAALIGFLVAIIGWHLPDTLGTGQETTEMLLRAEDQGSRLSLLFLLSLFAVKFLLTILCYCSGLPGGIFAPLLVQGAFLGLAVGEIGSRVAPVMTGDPAVLGVIGMASYFAAIVRAPLTAVVLIVEMTANYDLLFMLLAGSMTSYLVAEWFGEKPVYESLMRLNLQLRGPRDSEDPEPVLMELAVEPRSAMDRTAIRRLELPVGCLIVSIRRGRNGEEIIPSGDTVLHEGDEVTVVIAGMKTTCMPSLRALAISPD